MIAFHIAPELHFRPYAFSEMNFPDIRFLLTLQRGVTSTACHGARSHSFIYISTT